MKVVPTVSISDVERETGLSKDTLRAWERRYGFPKPARNSRDERVYSDEQVQRLHVLRRLLDSGLRPGKIVGLSLGELSAVVAPKSKAKRCKDETQESTQVALQLILAHRAEDLRDHLMHLLMQLGLRRFILDLVVPLNRLVGDAWLTGMLEIFEEHLYTNQVQALLQHALGAMHTPRGAPRVLLTTLPGEEHHLGMLMAHAFFAMEGAHCLSLGTQTPIADILKAAKAHRIDIVGLTCTANASRIPQAQLGSLRSKLDRNVELWVGGSVALLDPQPVPDLKRIASLIEISKAVAQWRVQNSTSLKPA